MNVRMLALAGLFVGVCLMGSSYAEGDGNGPPKHGNRHRGGRIQFILDHAKDLSLTDDQKTKLQALVPAGDGKTEGGDSKPAAGEGKGDGLGEKVKAILTEEQQTKLQELIKARQEQHKGDAKKGDGEKSDK